MKLSIPILFFASAAFSANLSASAASDDEPIPDFGVEGPVGFNQDSPDPGNSPIFADQNQARSSNRSPFGLRLALRQFELESDQQLAIREVLVQFARDGEKLRSEIKRVQDTLRAIRHTNGNESDVKNVHQSLRSLSQEGRILQAQFRESISEHLSDEQLIKFNQIQQARRKQAARRAKI